MQNFGMSMLWFWICYFLVTLVGILHTVFNIYVLHTKPTDAHSMGDGYEKKTNPGTRSIISSCSACLAICI